ncbi:hypothetical protein BC938DRAFT_482293 [Jimgerdemannia flammicorona]|uniref:Spt5 KOW domain-containing protein n=1 Tax=Jimgerdemannia flammicorona TaxID=994334 RepID=A0A433QEC2_9FUNG|nr:hypothetical protein BC938DRAFT_482293 [Jimgerdemannia flammicorona]
MHGLKVRVIRHRRTVTPYKDGIHDKHKGQVLRVDNSRRTCCVQLLEGRLSVLKSISWDHLEPVQPRKYEKVKVIKGEFRGRLGELCWTNENDGLVRFMETSEYKFVNMVDLAKYLGNKM